MPVFLKRRAEKIAALQNKKPFDNANSVLPNSKEKCLSPTPFSTTASSTTPLPVSICKGFVCAQPYHPNSGIKRQCPFSQTVGAFSCCMSRNLTANPGTSIMWTLKGCEWNTAIIAQK